MHYLVSACLPSLVRYHIPRTFPDLECLALLPSSVGDLSRSFSDSSYLGHDSLGRNFLCLQV